MTLRSVGVGFLATGAAAAAAEAHIGTIDVIKHVGTVCGAVYAAGRLVAMVLEWWNRWQQRRLEEMKRTVATEISTQLSDFFKERQ